MMSVSVRRILALAVLVGGILGGTAARAQATRMLAKTVDLEADGEVAMTVAVGSARITTWERPEVEIRLRVEGQQAEQIEDAELTVESAPRRVTIEAEHTGSEGGGILALFGLAESSGPDLHYTLRVPATADLSISAESAPVDVRGLDGNVTVEGASSPVRLRDVDGDATIATFSGSLDADSLRGDLMFATFSGNATVRRQRDGGKNQIATFSGSADVTLPADAAFDLRTDITWGGSVTSDFAMPDTTAQEADVVPVGGGGPTLAFESFSGSLTLRAE